jgi:MscS family membrane protein
VKAVENWLLGLMDTRYVFWVEIFVLVLASLTLGFLINKFILFLENRAGQTKTVWDDAIIEACRKPAVWLVWIVGVNFAVRFAALRIGSEWVQFIEYLNKVAVIFLASLFLVNLIKRAERNLVHPEYLAEPMDPTTVRAIGKLLRASIIITAVLIGMQVFGYSISGVLAFGGIGGLAVGFAAKDLLSNFFGGLMIYLDRPFAVGDWVRSPDKEIEGTVEDIGWRLTRIRTFDKRPLYIPNAVFNTIAIENPSRMLNRRIYETVGIRYDDLHQMEAIVTEVKQMLESHEEIDHDQTLMVNFNKFNASSLDFFIYTFTKTTVWTEFHRIKQDILLRVAVIIEAQGAEIAYPTTTVHLPDGVPIEQDVPDRTQPA